MMNFFYFHYVFLLCLFYYSVCHRLNKMENALEDILKINVKKFTKSISGGCINKGSVYQTEDNKLLFVKENSKFGVISIYILSLNILI